MPSAMPESLIFRPVFALPFQPYHSPIRNSVPRGKVRFVPSCSVASVPSDSAQNPTENGLLLPQSNERSMRQLDGISNGLSTCLVWSQTSSNIPPATMFQSPSFIALTRSEERRVGKECRSRWSPYH